MSLIENRIQPLPQHPHEFRSQLPPNIKPVTEQPAASHIKDSLPPIERTRAIHRFENALRRQQEEREKLIGSRNVDNSAGTTIHSLFEHHSPVLSPQREVRRGQFIEMVQDREANPPADQRTALSPVSRGEVQNLFNHEVADGPGNLHAVREAIAGREIE
jgi:hypothetical protein